jgi:competence ComEA-like helix-hairpin-helix protein
MEVQEMAYRKLLYGLFSMIIFGIVLAFSGTAVAQHEGGLGEKKIPLNIATVDQLMKIDGMTKELANAIVEYREKSGFFKKPEDLLNVPGITKKIYEKLNPQQGVEGDIYCVPKEGTEDDDDDEEPMLSPSKC